MKKFLQVVLILFLFSSTTEKVFSQYVLTSGGRLMRAQEAYLPNVGAFSIYNHFDFNTVAGAYGDGFGGAVPQWLMRNITVGDYVVFQNLQVSGAALLYQDVHHLDTKSSFLENITLVAKYASLPLFNENIYVGFLGSLMIPLGSGVYNSYGNPYTAGGTEIGVMTILSYYTDELFPRESFSVNLNLGYYNFLDNGKDISNNSNPLPSSASASALNYALAFRLPTSSVELMAEFWGWSFVNKPPLQAYTREDLSFITVGLKLRPLETAALTLGIDYLLSGNKDETSYNSFYDIIQRPGANPINYTQWRAIIGIQVNISNGTASTTRFGSTEEEVLLPETTSQGAMIILRKLEENYRPGGKDDAITTKGKEELSRRRIEIEQNLEVLRQILRQAESQQGTSQPSTNEPK
ncbi:MAG: hypothetical protein SFU91_00435 [Chloroherpetonaceae bacterium]|nr:hypothetical protein [Chloroherpetonaceae bacterium]